MQNAFEVKNLSVWYNYEDTKALDNLSMAFPANSINIVLGQNGSGKSTLLRCLSGVQVWNSGDILKFGISRSDDYKDFNQDQIFVSEDIQLPFMTLKDLVAVYQDIWKKFDIDTFDRILAWGELPTKKRFYQLSKGQKILAQFALALGSQCKIVLIDEVTAALDPYIRAKVAEELISYKEKHAATIILATNIATEFPRHDANIFLIRSNQLYLEGQFSKLQKEFIKIQCNRQKREAFEKEGFVFINSYENDLIHLLGRKGMKFSLNECEKLSESSITLEEIFIFLSDRRKQ